MLCKNCQSNVKSDFKYCPYCGERIISDYHDHYAELTPPPIITMDEPDEAAAYYAPSPEERAPRFAEEAFTLPAFEDELPAYEPEPDDAPEPPRADYAPEPKPYFVYDPDSPEDAQEDFSAPSAGERPVFQIPRIENADELPRGPVYSPPPAPPASGPGAGTKLLAISLSLFGGVAAGVLLYQLLMYLA